MAKQYFVANMFSEMKINCKKQNEELNTYSVVNAFH